MCWIKVCVILLIFSLIAKFIAGLLMNQENLSPLIVNSAGTVTNAVVGIFVLREERGWRLLYGCLVSTCRSCETQCAGGSQCLCMWLALSLIGAVFGLLPVRGSDILQIYDNFQKLAADWETTRTNILWVVYYSTIALALIAKVLGSYHGLKAMHELFSHAGNADGTQGPTGENGQQGTQQQGFVPWEGPAHRLDV